MSYCPECARLEKQNKTLLNEQEALESALTVYRLIFTQAELQSRIDAFNGIIPIELRAALAASEPSTQK